MKKIDPRYPAYLIYQREYQKNRRQTDLEFRAKRNWAVSKCNGLKKERPKSLHDNGDMYRKPPKPLSITKNNANEPLIGVIIPIDPDQTP